MHKTTNDIFVENQAKIGKKPDGQPMAFGQNWLKMNPSKLALNPLRTVQGAISNYDNLRKFIKSPNNFPSKSDKNLKKA